MPLDGEVEAVMSEERHVNPPVLLRGTKQTASVLVNTPPSALRSEQPRQTGHVCAVSYRETGRICKLQEGLKNDCKVTPEETMRLQQFLQSFLGANQTLNTPNHSSVIEGQLHHTANKV